MPECWCSKRRKKCYGTSK